MDHPPLVRRHGLEGYRTPCPRDALSDALSEIGQRLVASLLVAGNVNEDTGSLTKPLTRDEADDEMEGSEGLPPTADQKARVVPIDVENRASDVLVQGLLEADDRGHAHLRDEVLEDVGGNLHYVGRFLKQRDPDPGRFAADTENSGLALANDVYFDVRAVGVELL